MASILSLAVMAVQLSFAEAATGSSPATPSNSNGNGSTTQSAASGSTTGLTNSTSSSTVSSDSSSAARPPSSVETKGQFAVDLLANLHKSPLVKVRSYYTDIATSSPTWGYVALALQYGLFKPDETHRVGVNDAVTSSLLAFDVARLYGVPVSSPQAAAAWAESVGLLSHSDLVNTGGISVDRMNTFLQAMDAWAAGQRTFPHSFSLSVTEANPLGTALVQAGQMTSYQLAVTESKAMSVQLTAAGAKNPADVQLAAATLKQSSTMKSTIASSWSTKTQALTALISENTMPMALPRTASKSATKTSSSSKIGSSRTVYVSGSNVYVNDGTGWKLGTVNSSNFASTCASLRSLAGQILLTGFMGVSVDPSSTVDPKPATKTSGTATSASLKSAPSSTTSSTSNTAANTASAGSPASTATNSITYTATLLPAVIAKFLTGVLTSTGLQSTTNIIGNLVQDTSIKVTLTIAPVGQTWQLAHETWVVTVSVPSSDFNLLSGNKMSANENAAFLLGVQSVTESITTDVAILPQPDVIAAPNGLPSPVKQTAAQ